RDTAGSAAAPAARWRKFRRGSFIAPASVLIMARINSSVWLARPIKKEVHLSEEPPPILLHLDKLCGCPDLDEPLVRAAREFVEDSLRALAGSHLIPLSGDHQRWNLDPPGIVVWLSCLPVISNVMKNPGRTS